ncbi:MAG: tRNA 2-thiocytidine biosynthesis TtcA family protein [Paludibacteraceae bacterium]|nr:tRNA 2-thiocytidine biosynthesis TtcA family protein [Paludibacteraceae bacterium]
MTKTPQQIQQEQIRKHLFGRFHHVCAEYDLLADGDKVLIGLSGGKDSLLLTELLGAQARIHVPKINVCAVHVRVEGRAYQSDMTYLEDFCREAGVPLLVRDTKIVGEEKKEPCFLCSWYRRKALLDTAQELGCNKIALGHHQDDVLHTLLMNLVYEGRCSSIMPVLQLDKMPIAMIRPLWGIAEAEIQTYASLRGYQKQVKTCPFEKETARTQMAGLLQQLEGMNENVRSSLIHSITSRQ